MASLLPDRANTRLPPMRGHLAMPHSFLMSYSKDLERIAPQNGGLNDLNASAVENRKGTGVGYFEA